MPNFAHRIYIISLVSIVLFVFFYLLYNGVSYYSTPFEERFYHPDHDLFKPSGLFGHGLGIIGSLLILIGVFSYIARKRYRFLSRLGRLKYWLEFHIFLCVLGPVMILFHTAFKFGGIVSVSFWSMVAVVASGVIGRYIYLQIPRSIEGKELSLNEVRSMKSGLDQTIFEEYRMVGEFSDLQLEMSGMSSRNKIRTMRNILREKNFPSDRSKRIISLFKQELSVGRKIERLQTMQKLFNYWHIVHLPFAIIMLVIMIVHVVITVAFGARWIF